MQRPKTSGHYLLQLAAHARTACLLSQDCMRQQSDRRLCQHKQTAVQLGTHLLHCIDTSGDLVLLDEFDELCFHCL